MKQLNQILHLLKGGTIVTVEGLIRDGWLLIEKGKIKGFGSNDSCPNDTTEMIVTHIDDVHLIFPGFIDVHIHGTSGADVMDGTKEALATMVEALPAEGTTCFLATTITQSDEAISRTVNNVAQFMKTDYKGAEILGIHLEGPFISQKHAGAQPVEHIIPPDIALLKKWNQLANGTISLVTLAPEEDDGLDFIKYLKHKGIIVSVGHSHATYENVKNAVSSGLSHATHLFNAMRAMHHREPGVVGAVLLDDRISAEIICDGLHVVPEMIELALKTKGIDKLQLITDGMRAKCLHNGRYEFGGNQVTVDGNGVRLQNGTLAGSILKMNEAAKMVYKLGLCQFSDLTKITSVNAAKELGVYDRKGSISIGKDADLVILDQDFNVIETYCRGIKF